MKPNYRRIYLIGSLRNPFVPDLARHLRPMGHTVFDDWHAAGPEADDHWQKYETARGRSYGEALYGHAAEHVFAFDKENLEWCDTAIMVMPAGKSGHLELGYIAGQGKDTFIYFDKEPDRWDLMYKFATEVFFDQASLLKHLVP